MDWIKNGSIDNLIILIVSSLLLISNISLIIVVGKIVTSNNIRSENKIMKEKIESQYRHYLRLQESQIKVKKLYHDMNNHVLCIENMYNKNEKAKDYIENLKQELQQVNGINSTGNMILDIILSEKKSICEENNISFLADINFSKCKFIDMVDICSIYSNLLDNAIEASKKIDEEKNRNIKIVGNIVNSFFVVKCENYKVNKIVKSNNKIFTDKKNKFIHGIGIDSIRNSVEKYNGNLAIEYSEEKFIVNIYIPLR